jgi:hypothetical protein
MSRKDKVKSHFSHSAPTLVDETNTLSQTGKIYVKDKEETANLAGE